MPENLWWLHLEDPCVKAFLVKNDLTPLKWAKLLLKDVFEEPPVTMREFLFSPDFADWQGDLWPNVQALLEEFDKSKYREGFLGLGRGSGKSALGSLFLARQAYWLLNLKNPWAYYGLRKNTLLTVLNVSVSGAQAQSVVFDTLCGIIENSRYFHGKFSKRTSLGHADLYFPVKRIRAISGHSGSTVWRGYAVFAAVADEISWFLSKANKDNAEDICQVLKGSMATRFPDSYKLLAISSLKSRTDFLSKTLTGLRKETLEKQPTIDGIDEMRAELGIPGEK